MTTTTPKKLNLRKLRLSAGAHQPDGEFCVMEAVAYVAGEVWSDHPKCACPVISAFMRRWNDDLNDADRQKLKPYITRLVNTKSTPAVEGKRAWLVTDWMVRTYTPAWLELAGLNEQANAVRALPEISGPKDTNKAMPALNDAKEKAAAAWDAAGAAAGAAAWYAAGDAAWDATGAAAGAAAGDAAWDAAGDAAWAAAWTAALAAARAAGAAWDAAAAAAAAAAGDATGAAAGAKLKPTVVSLQKSAIDLLDRLIDCTEGGVA